LILAVNMWGGDKKMGIMDEIRRRINKSRWERWRAKRNNKEREKSYFLLLGPEEWLYFGKWTMLFECLMGDCLIPFLSWITQVPLPEPPGGPCGACFVICIGCYYGCYFAVTGIGAIVAAALCAGCGICLGAEVGYCLEQCEIV